MTSIDEVMRTSPVIPVLVIERAEAAAPMAEAFIAGGLEVLEVTLRTPAALDAIRAMKSVPGAIVGAGTVLNEEQLHASIDAGADFIVSPGLAAPLAETAIASKIPYLPGVATASEIMLGLGLGLTRFKFFPAEAMGGQPTLAALSSVFATCRFCPTGGITRGNVASWLALPSVLCVGGTWLAKGDSVDVHAVREAAELLR
jgi:2-dehydro-3-deoxyphosphogluconate aldolase / (4S)-4-hydroxy-2-oxoglutarate aldolase